VPRPLIGTRSDLAVLVVVGAVGATLAGPVRVAAQDLGTDAQRESGRTLYGQYCAQCHGADGDGEGYAASHLLPRPRDFTAGQFKVRTTPSGSLPTHQDLVDIIRRGMPYTSMPAWSSLSDRQVSDLAEYVKTFSGDFSNPDNTLPAVALPNAPSVTEESVERGKQLYEETGCVRCHGTLGRGDGPSAPTLTDDAGRPIDAADLTQSWTFRGGSSREDIFRTMTTGFSGTPMPSFDEALDVEQRWAITDFIASLSDDEPDYANLVIASHLEDPIDLAAGVAVFESAGVARFPIIGQIMQPGRAFHPSTTSVTVQAVYDAESVALLVRWHDLRADTAGTTGPSLPVPPEEEVAMPGPVGGQQTPAAVDPADPFGVAQPVDPFATLEADAATVAPPSEFNDAVAIQIPSEAPAGARKPYFLFGDAQNAVDLWFFDLASAGPVQFSGRGSGDIVAGDATDVTGVASYDQGEWSVVFKRPLEPTAGASFVPGGFMPIAFSVWDGFARERGSRRGLTVWYSLYLQPEEVPSAAGPMVRTALLILAVQLVAIVWVRRRYSASGRA